MTLSFRKLFDLDTYSRVWKFPFLPNEIALKKKQFKENHLMATAGVVVAAMAATYVIKMLINQNETNRLEKWWKY